MARNAFIAGSFDPVTVGHLELIARTAALFDRVAVALCSNPAKTYFFPEEIRFRALQAAVASLPNAEVVRGEGLTAQFAVSHGADVIVKGIRNAADYAYEQEMAEINRRISGIETLFLCSSPENAAVSSTLVRELYKNGADITRYVPAPALSVLLDFKK